MAVSPFGDSVALATKAAIHTVDLLDAACSHVQLSSGGLASAVSAGSRVTGPGRLLRLDPSLHAQLGGAATCS